MASLRHMPPPGGDKASGLDGDLQGRRIREDGTPEQVFSQTERLHGYHLDVPQAAELRDELVKAGIPMPENVITPEACAEELFKLLK